MEKRARSIISIILLVVVAVAAYRYKAYMIDRNFMIAVNTVCDPATENCFVADCSPDDPECDASPYKKIEILAKDAPSCLEEHTCESFTCTDISSCTATYCSSDTIEDGEICAPVGGQQ